MEKLENNMWEKRNISCRSCDPQGAHTRADLSWKTAVHGRFLAGMACEGLYEMTWSGARDKCEKEGGAERNLRHGELLFLSFVLILQVSFK